jgi:hypothetical protein
MNYKINLKQFLDFCKGVKLFLGLDHLGEKPGVKKSNRLIYLYTLLMCVLGKSSFLAMDQVGRIEKFKRIFKVDRYPHSRYRHTVVSDTTLIRRLAEIPIKELREINYHLLQVCLSLGYVKPLAIVDGTSWSGRLYSCLCFVTRWGDVWMVDFEPIEKKGKELIASQRLIERCCEYLGKGVIELLLADMLYFNERFWQLREAGYVKELLIKYTPKSDELLAEPYRLVLQRFQAVKAIYDDVDKSKADKTMLYRMGFETLPGRDEQHKVDYTIYRLRNNSWDNRYQIALVEETRYQCGEVLLPFYVITTLKTMTCEALRENGHKRWYIENDGFKMLNAHLKSKRHWSKDEQVMEPTILIWMLGFSLLCLFRKEYQHHIRKTYRKVKETLAFVSNVLMIEPFGRVCLDGI